VGPVDHPRLASEAPLARSALAVAIAGVIFGFCFVPQLLGLALGGLSLAREPMGRRHALLAIALSIALTIVWGIVLGAFLKWWANSQA
jgi:hypothetical protein